MFNISKLLVVALTGFSLTAQADLKSAEIRLGETVTLTNCGGTANLKKDYAGNLILSVRGTTCANFRTLIDQGKLNGSGNQDRYIDLTIAQDKGTRRVLIGSNEYIKTDGANQNSLGDLLYVVPPKAPVANTIPSNWKYEARYEDYLFYYEEVCRLIDSNGNEVMDMQNSVCASGTRSIPDGTFYSYQSGTNQCYLWLNNYERVSDNAVKQEKCNK